MTNVRNAMSIRKLKFEKIRIAKPSVGKSGATLLNHRADQDANTSQSQLRTISVTRHQQPANVVFVAVCLLTLRDRLARKLRDAFHPLHWNADHCNADLRALHVCRQT